MLVAFLIGVAVGLALPWVVVAIRDGWRGRQTGKPEGTAKRAGEVWR